LGFIYWVIFFNIAILLILCIILCLEKTIFRCKCFNKCRHKLQGKLIWNGLIRLYLETFADVSITAFLNTYTADWSNRSPVVMYSNVLAIAFLSI